MRAEAEAEDTDAEKVDEELSSDGIGSKSDAGYPQTPGANPSYDATTDLSVGVKKDSGKPEAAGTDYKKVADINEEDDYDFGGEEEDPNAAEIAELKARLAELEGEEEEAPMEAEYGMDSEEDPMEGEYGMDSEEDSEDAMDLESIIRELESQLGDEEETNEEEHEEEDPNAAQIAELRRQLAELEGSEEEEPKTESKRLRESRRRLKENLADGSEAGTDKGETPKVVVTNEAEEEDDTLDLDEILREMEADMAGDKEKVDEEEDKEELKADLNEAYKTIKSLQKTINEVNLLNAKLLFANKLFRAHNMTNEQKVKVIETLDRTKSVREVKLVFSTLAENFKYTTSSNKLTKRAISEGIASKAVKSTKPAQAKAVINESVNFANRFKKLAGIIK
jgi:chromosome segregation ATPase